MWETGAKIYRANKTLKPKPRAEGKGRKNKRGD